MGKYDQLIRDRTPEIIRAAGKVPVIRIVTDADELKQCLLDKLAAKMQAYQDTESVEKIADILEVMQAIVEHVHGLKWEDIRELQGRKWEERGGFDKGIVLERVDD